MAPAAIADDADLVNEAGVRAPSTPPLDPPRAEVADDVARQVADALGTLARDGWASKYVRVARLEGDQNDQVRMRIEDELPARTNCRLVKDTLLAEIRDKLEHFTLLCLRCIM